MTVRDPQGAVVRQQTLPFEIPTLKQQHRTQGGARASSHDPRGSGKSRGEAVVKVPSTGEAVVKESSGQAAMIKKISSRGKPIEPLGQATPGKKISSRANQSSRQDKQ